MSRSRSAILAEPETIRNHPELGYVMYAKIVNGPANIQSRVIVVRLTTAQLNAISEWDGSDPYVVDLENINGDAASS